MIDPGPADCAGEQALALTEILARTYEATSTDGSVMIRVLGDARLGSASIAAEIDSAGVLSTAATEAAQSGLHQARRHTARALAELPGLNPQLRALLLGGT